MIYEDQIVKDIRGWHVADEVDNLRNHKNIIYELRWVR